MKIFWIFFYTTTFLWSCGNNNQKTKRSQKEATEKIEVESNEDDPQKNDTPTSSAEQKESQKSETQNQATKESDTVNPNYVFPGAVWTKKNPEELCNTPENIEAFIKNVGGNGAIIKNGYLIRQWGNDVAGQNWASATKPIFSTLLFFAIEEGLLESTYSKISPYWPQISGKDKEITFHHLANMMSGYARGENPGAAWAYNDYGIQLYFKTLFSKIFQNDNANQVVKDHLSGLQLEDGEFLYQVGNAYRFASSSRDFARLGWFWLNKGYWGGQQILPRKYFDEFMKPHVGENLPVSNIEGTDNLGIGTMGGGSSQTLEGPGLYGYNWWFNPNQIAFPDAPSDMIQANGHFNQEVMVMFPSLGMVIAARANWGEFVHGDSNGTMNKNLKLLSEACTND